jgi:hypothetical protein
VARRSRDDRLAELGYGTLMMPLGYGTLMMPLGDATKAGAAIPWPVDVAIGVLCSSALLARRGRPLGTCLALLPVRRDLGDGHRRDPGRPLHRR